MLFFLNDGNKVVGGGTQSPATSGLIASEIIPDGATNIRTTHTKAHTHKEKQENKTQKRRKKEISKKLDDVICEAYLQRPC